MSDSSNREPRENASADVSTDVSADGAGVLAGLPRTRPQRASPRRAAARTAAARGAPTQPVGAAGKAPGTREGAAPSKREGAAPSKLKDAAPSKPKRAAPNKTKGQAPAKPEQTRRPVVEPVPRQGYESEPDLLSGSIQPPGGPELVASAAELAGELAKAGVNTGARLLRDLLSRLPSG